MVLTAASRAQANAAGSTAAGSSSATTSATSSSATTSSSSSAWAQQSQVSLLGTLPMHVVPALLGRIESQLVTLPARVLCEKETVLSRHDDHASAVRETGDNAWASVVKARKRIKLRVREAIKRYNTSSMHRSDCHTVDSVECTLCLALPSLPERQYPKASVRPCYNVELLSDTPIGPHHDMAKHPIHPLTDTHPLLGFNPDSYLDTDLVNGWKSFVSSIGWRPHFKFLRYGLTFPLNDFLSRHSSTQIPALTNPAHGTMHTLNVFRIFTPDPSGYTDEWTPLDPDGATVVVELIATVGAQLDQSHFNIYCSTTDAGAAQTGGGLDPTSTIESAIEFADSVAKTLRGLVDLKREAYD